MAQRPSGEGWTVSDAALWDAQLAGSELSGFHTDYRAPRPIEDLAHHFAEIERTSPFRVHQAPPPPPDFSAVRAIHARPLGSRPAKEDSQ